MPRFTPLFVTEKTAAALFDMKPAEFRLLVEHGALPKPRDIRGFERWRVADFEAIWTGDALTEEIFEV
ncbi:hypothetical protein DSM110093_01990 [Sulfitobacter sp. DSM 110093]|nr:hypothetical protein DSM110093_01990 [Sulfitobacter sp. DSM 110093]